MSILKPKTTNSNGAAPRQSWLTELNLHWAGVALLALVNIYLLAQMAFVWHAASKHSASAMADQRVELKTAEIAAVPLRGLDSKLAGATAGADRFYRQRLPGSYSEVAAELGTLTKKANVRLARVQYAPATVLAGSPGQLTEVRMDASLSGDYRPLMLLLNSLERDKMFFLISKVTLTGQQSGTVTLRLGLTTYLRENAAQEQPPNSESASDSATPAAGGPR